MSDYDKKKGRRKDWWWIPECAYKKGMWKRRVSEGNRQEYNIHNSTEAE